MDSTCRAAIILVSFLSCTEWISYLEGFVFSLERVIEDNALTTSISSMGVKAVLLITLGAGETDGRSWCGASVLPLGH